MTSPPGPPTDRSVLREEFAKQAAHWGRDGIDEDLLWAVGFFGLEPHFRVLDVAAGSGLVARAMAAHVAEVVAVDVTPEMLEEGRKRARAEGKTNIRFEEGDAEELPYPAGSFDLVATRFSFHHMERPAAALAEMVRVGRLGGLIAVVDIVSPEDPDLAKRSNRLERLRDPSHTRALPASELPRLVGASGVRVETERLRDVTNDVEDWLARSETPDDRRQEILEALRAELTGGPPTGMRPGLVEGRLTFPHTWSVVVGRL